VTELPNPNATWTYQILGSIVRFATYDAIAKEVLVTYANGETQVVEGVQAFGASFNNQDAIMQLVATQGS
jgi:hypothetical protein